MLPPGPEAQHLGEHGGNARAAYVEVTAFNYFLHPQVVLVSMDTLRSDPGRAIHGFSSKVFPLPHLHGVLCGTGSLDLVLEWFRFIQTRASATDMRDLDDVAPEQLALLAANKAYSGIESTLYHFGLDRIAGQLRGWAYRSTNSFQSESLVESGLGLKPAPPAVESLQRLWFEIAMEGDAAHAFVEVMKLQKEYDRKRAPGERVGIGGEIHLLALTAESQTLWTCHEFDDYAADFRRSRDDDIGLLEPD